MRSFEINGKVIDDDSAAYVIAEIGHNHQGDIELCEEMIDAAADAGCDAVKLQKRDNKSLYAKAFYEAPYNSENAFGKTYGEHREALEFDKDAYRHLQSYSQARGIDFFATAFDVQSLAFLQDLNVPAVKIASGDLKNTALLKAAKEAKIPVILSTGGGDMTDVLKAAHILDGVPHAILQCTSGYPASYDDLNLRVIETFRAAFPNTVIGWSAHDTGTVMALVAYALGARIIEKHFTLDRAMKGTDQAMSLEPKGMEYMIENLDLAFRSLGDGNKRQLDSEIEPLKKQRKNADGYVDGLTCA